MVVWVCPRWRQCLLCSKITFKTRFTQRIRKECSRERSRKVTKVSAISIWTILIVPVVVRCNRVLGWNEDTMRRIRTNYKWKKRKIFSKWHVEGRTLREWIPVEESNVRACTRDWERKKSHEWPNENQVTILQIAKFCRFIIRDLDNQILNQAVCNFPLIIVIFRVVIGSGKNNNIE